MSGDSLEMRPDGHEAGQADEEQRNVTISNPYEYAVKQELKWLKEDIDITKKCIEEFTQYAKKELTQRLRDSVDEMSRLNIFMQEFKEKSYCKKDGGCLICDRLFCDGKSQQKQQL